MTENLSAPKPVVIADLHPVYLNHANNALAADRANVNFACTSHASADMATVVEQGVLFLAIADLTKIHLFVRHFPVADTLSMALAIFVATDVFIASLAFDKCSLSVTLAFHPVSLIAVTGRILHFTLSVTLPKDEISGVCRAIVGNVRAFTVVIAFIELSAVVISVKRGIDCLCTRKGPRRMVAGRRPYILN